MLKAFELGLSLAMTVGIYWPLYARTLRRRHTRDFSKLSSWFVFLVQVNNLFLAGAENANYLVAWYMIQSLLCGIQLWFIYRFWNTNEPRYREQNEKI
jgi:hypothetical protein